MGNYASCALGGQNGKQSKAAKVIFPSSGEVKQFPQPTKAAELMLETPSSFVVNSRSLQIGRRFSPLNADEDLEIGNVYVMFPMQRVNSLVNAADMGALFLAAKRGAGKVRVVPAAETVAQVPEEFQHRRSVSRLRKPVLETIVEEPVASR